MNEWAPFVELIRTNLMIFESGGSRRRLSSYKKFEISFSFMLLNGSSVSKKCWKTTNEKLNQPAISRQHTVTIALLNSNALLLTRIFGSTFKQYG